MGELKAEEKLKEKQQLKKEIEEKVNTELKFEKDKEIIRLSINQYIEKKFNEVDAKKKYFEKELKNLSSFFKS